MSICLPKWKNLKNLQLIPMHQKILQKTPPGRMQAREQIQVAPPLLLPHRMLTLKIQFPQILLDLLQKMLFQWILRRTILRVKRLQEIPLQTLETAAMTPSHETVALVEWQKGTRKRFRYEGGQVVFYREDPRPAPCNYGCIPALINPADDAEVDVIWLDDPLEVGWTGPIEITGLLHLDDQDHKVLTGNLQNIQPILDWFPPERGAQVLSRQAALEWLSGLTPAPPSHDSLE